VQKSKRGKAQNSNRYYCFLVLRNSSGVPRSLALTMPSPFNFALEKALRRHVLYRTANAMELWRDLNGPMQQPALENNL